MSVIEKRIELLKEQNDRLTKLLADPQPGLFTWMEMVPECVDEIVAIMEGRRDV